jgi:benzoyl-CoA reductase/2-hydroxyglutaryl-CoA dehydratase subunit BcrC/BadD/HgdB
MCVFLGSSQLTVRLKDALVKRINERRTSLSTLLQYLQKSNQSYENLDLLLNFQQLGKAAIANAVVQMNGRLNKAVEEPDVESVASDSDESMETTTPSNV